MRETGTRGGLLYDENGDLVGYFYVNGSGHIGPLAVTRPEAAAAAFITALHAAVATGAPQVSAFVPGTAEAALRIAIESGLQITLPMVLMSSQAFGDWTRYLPRNPGFM